MDAGTLGAMGTFMNFGYYLGFAPYKYSMAKTKIARKDLKESLTVPKSALSNSQPGEKMWIFNGSPWRRHFHKFLVILAGLYQLFLVTRTVQVFSDEGISMPDKLKVLYLTGIFSIMFFYHALTIKYYGDNGKYLNAVLDLGYKYTSKVKGQLSFRFSVFLILQ